MLTATLREQLTVKQLLIVLAEWAMVDCSDTDYATTAPTTQQHEERREKTANNSDKLRPCLTPHPARASASAQDAH